MTFNLQSLAVLGTQGTSLALKVPFSMSCTVEYFQYFSVIRDYLIIGELFWYCKYVFGTAGTSFDTKYQIQACEMYLKNTSGTK